MHRECAARRSRLVITASPRLDHQGWASHRLLAVPRRSADRRRVLVDASLVRRVKPPMAPLSLPHALTSFPTQQPKTIIIVVNHHRMVKVQKSFPFRWIAWPAGRDACGTLAKGRTGVSACSAMGWLRRVTCTMAMLPGSQRSYFAVTLVTVRRVT